VTESRHSYDSILSNKTHCWCCRKYQTSTFAAWKSSYGLSEGGGFCCDLLWYSYNTGVLLLPVVSAYFNYNGRWVHSWHELLLPVPVLGICTSDRWYHCELRLATCACDWFVTLRTLHSSLFDIWWWWNRSVTYTWDCSKYICENTIEDPENQGKNFINKHLYHDSLSMKVFGPLNPSFIKQHMLQPAIHKARDNQIWCLVVVSIDSDAMINGIPSQRIDRDRQRE
jgi:hypothetical protein